MINFQRKLQKIWRLGAHLEIMEEGEQKLCLVEPTLELEEKTPLQVQMQLLEKMEGGEALAAEVVLEAAAAELVLQLPLILIQQGMEV